MQLNNQTKYQRFEREMKKKSFPWFLLKHFLTAITPSTSRSLVAGKTFLLRLHTHFPHFFSLPFFSFIFFSSEMQLFEVKFI